MLKSLFDQRDCTFTCFSPSDRVVEILRFFNFQTWPMEKVIFTPASGLHFGSRGPPVEVVTSPPRIEALLDEEQRRIRRDHLPYRCGHLVLRSGDRTCYVVTVRRGRDVRAFADVLHASDPGLLLRAIARTHLPMARAHRTFLTGIDRRFLNKLPLGTFIYRDLCPLQFRSSSLQLGDIDSLYSELVPLCA
jgi:hypothetical protein